MIYISDRKQFSKVDTKPTKLCIECKFFKSCGNADEDYRLARCLRNAMVTPDMTGNFCDINRENEIYCGRSAGWFEPKEAT